MLLCLPHAGGSAVGGFGRWARDASGSVQAVPLELAGRGRRAGEPPYETLDDAAADCAGWLREHVDGAPFALFGHSTGGVLAYVLTGHLEAIGAPKPFAVILAGSIPPNRADRPRTTHALPDDAFLATIEQLGGLPAIVVDHPEARTFYLELLRADYRMLERFELSDPPYRLSVPLLLLSGSADPVTRPDDAEHWRQLSAAAVIERTLPGAGHFFPTTHRDETWKLVDCFARDALRGEL